VSAPSHLASDADREAAAARLRQAAAEGRMDADELEQRVADAYRARTIGDLTTVTADLPVPVPPRVPASQRLASADLGERLIGFITPNLICIAVWLATGTDGSFWPKWVLLITGIAFVLSMLKTVFDVDDEEEDKDKRRLGRGD
jgi:DUF1707 SHOCT-like domain